MKRLLTVLMLTTLYTQAQEQTVTTQTEIITTAQPTEPSIKDISKVKKAIFSDIKKGFIAVVAGIFLTSSYSSVSFSYSAATNPSQTHAGIHTKFSMEPTPLVGTGLVTYGLNKLFNGIYAATELAQAEWKQTFKHNVSSTVITA